MGSMYFGNTEVFEQFPDCLKKIPRIIPTIMTLKADCNITYMVYMAMINISNHVRSKRFSLTISDYELK